MTRTGFDFLKKYLTQFFIGLEFLDVLRFDVLLSIGHRWLGEMLTLTQLFHGFGAVKFTFETLQSPVNIFSFLDGNYQHCGSPPFIVPSFKSFTRPYKLSANSLPTKSLVLPTKAFCFGERVCKNTINFELTLFISIF